MGQDSRGITMPMSEVAFRRLALEEPNQWELHCGIPRRKPGMTAAHNRTAVRLAGELYSQLDRREYDIRCNLGHVRSSPQHYYIPDVVVPPVEQVQTHLGTRALEYYSDPLPLVVEVWSPSLGTTTSARSSPSTGAAAT
jgi:Uma2 family endonuclease